MMGLLGSFEVIDFMPRYTGEGAAGTRGDLASDIVRVLRLVSGKPKVKINFDPQLEYAQDVTEVKPHQCGLKATTGWPTPKGDIYESAYLWTSFDANAVRNGEEIELTESGYLLLTYHDKVQVVDQELVELMLQRTRAYWLLWVARTHKTVQYKEEMVRSALLLKLLQFGPTGALVAAATTSLPETIGEERNWDYRFCWIRDGFHDGGHSQ